MSSTGLLVVTGRRYRWQGHRVRAGFMFGTTEGVHVAINYALEDGRRERRNVPIDELDAIDREEANGVREAPPAARGGEREA